MSLYTHINCPAFIRSAESAFVPKGLEDSARAESLSALEPVDKETRPHKALRVWRSAFGVRARARARRRRVFGSG
jgi:hypothetical protein